MRREGRRGLCLTHHLQSQLNPQHLGMCHFHLPQLPVLSHLLGSGSATFCREEKSQPSAAQSTAGPAAHPPLLSEEAEAGFSAKTLRPFYSPWSGTSAGQPFPFQSSLTPDCLSLAFKHAPLAALSRSGFFLSQ